MGDNHKLYKVLDIGRNASEDEIKNAYRRLAKKHHPDKSVDFLKLIITKFINLKLT